MYNADIRDIEAFVAHQKGIEAFDATPSFGARIEEAGVPWPPAKPMDYPDKTW